MATTYEVLAEPNRRRILDVLRDGERSVGELVTELDLRQPSVSKHLKSLEAVGLVRARAEGRRRCYRLRIEPMLELDAWLQPYREIWADRLDDLAQHLDDMED